MLVQDTLTGAVHEVPDSQLYEADYGEGPEQMAEGQILYDGLGNPVGFSFLKKAFRAASRLAPLASRLAPLASLLPVPGAGLLTQAAQRVLPGVIRQLAPAARQLQRVLPPGMVQQFAPVAQAFQQAVPAAAPPGAIGGFYGEAMARSADTSATHVRATDARAGRATAARMDSPPIALPGHQGASACICDASSGEVQRAWSPLVPPRRHPRRQSLPRQFHRGL